MTGVQTCALPIFNELLDNEIENSKNYAGQKHIHLVNGTSVKIMITADEKMVSTILRNLISNALKYTPKDGMVTIEAKRGNGLVEVSVSDTGVGMEKVAIEALFKIETSYTSRGTANEKGTGLGLLLVKEFVEKHSGTIRVESETGKGSRFTISIPDRP